MEKTKLKRTPALSSIERNLSNTGFSFDLDALKNELSLEIDEVDEVKEAPAEKVEELKEIKEEKEEKKEKKALAKSKDKKDYTIELTDVPGRGYSKRRSKEQIEEDKKNGYVYKSTKKQVSLMLWDSNVEGLEAIAEKTGYTPTNIINQIIRNYLKGFE